MLCINTSPGLEPYHHAKGDCSQFLHCILWILRLHNVQDLAQKYNVRAMPTFVAFLKGEKVGEVVGADLGKIGGLIQQYALFSALPTSLSSFA
jgi:hypothetical protein